MKLKKGTFFLLILWLSGCTGVGAVRSDLDIPIQQIKKAISNIIPTGIRERSENKREYYSNYFLRSGGKEVRADKFPKRKYAHFVIVGDRRPYIVKVYVYVEDRSGKDRNGFYTYRYSHEDKVYAKFLLRKLFETLDKRRDELNFIDDFRVF